MSRPKVLLIEDDPSVRHGMAAFLRANELDVEEAGNCKQAMDLFRADNHDVVVADYSLPDGTSLDILPQVKKLSEDTPFIILTAHTDRMTQRKLMNSGADDFITKPLLAEELLAAVEARLRRRREAREAAEGALQRLAAIQEELVRERTAVLAAANQELEAFNSSVCHDLRSPLQIIDGFSELLLEHWQGRPDQAGLRCVARIRAASQRMRQLIDDLLQLSRADCSELRQEEIDLSSLGREVLSGLAPADPTPPVAVSIQDGLVVQADRSLMLVALENLLGNAMK